MKKSLIASIVLVVVLVAGAVYFSTMKKAESPTVAEENTNDDADLALGQNLAGDPTQTGDTDLNQKTLTIDASVSKATYEINEVLKGKPTHVIGNSSTLSGTVMIDSVSKKINGAEVKVDATSFKTDIAMRDGNVKKLVLKSDQEGNEFISFSTTSVEGVPATVVVGTEFPVKVTGDMVIAGVTKSVTFDGTVKYGADNSATVNASTTLAYGDFGLSIPNLPFLANVDKTVKLSVVLVAKE